MSSMKYRILAAGGALLLVALAVFRPAAHPSAALTEDPSASPPAHRARLHSPAAGEGGVVYVVGAVNHPGLYHIAAEARTNDAVRAAGGLRGDADPVGVNLASFAHDGDEIVVPVLGESISRVAKHRARAPRTHKTTDAEVVDVNTADAATLATVPGIGKAIAERIVAVRDRDGAYDAFDQLLDVAGMTQSRLDRASPYLRI
jgi:competence protein ComEA